MWLLWIPLIGFTNFSDSPAVPLSCGEACVRMLLESDGVSYDVGSLRRELELTENYETSMAHIRSALERRGYFVKAFSGTYDDLLNSRDPVIVHMLLDASSRRGHFGVIKFETATNQ